MGLAADAAAGTRIVAGAVAAAITYGVAHDQVTARVCVEYFTVAHPPVFETSDPTLLGLGWGVIATWWVGLLLGLPLAAAARLGDRWPKLELADVARPIGVLLLVMAASALVAGLIGHAAQRAGHLVVAEPFAREIPTENHAAFLAAGGAHLASYAVGFLGGLVVIAYTVWRRVAAAPERATSEPGLDAPALPPSVDRALTYAARLVAVAQLGLLWVAAVLGLATLATNTGTTGVLLARLASGALALASLGLGAAAWRRQGPLARGVTALLALPAAWLGLVCCDNVLR